MQAADADDPGVTMRGSIVCAQTPETGTRIADILSSAAFGCQVYGAAGWYEGLGNSGRSRPLSPTAARRPGPTAEAATRGHGDGSRLHLLRRRRTRSWHPPARRATSRSSSLQNPFNPFSYTPFARNVAAACEMFERTTRRYAKPSFGLPTTTVDGQRVDVVETVVWSRPFCSVIAFDRPGSRGGGQAAEAPDRGADVGPLRDPAARHGRGLPADARGDDHRLGRRRAWCRSRPARFDLDDYIDYVIAMCGDLGPDLHILAVCQPSVPVIAAVARHGGRGRPGASRAP